MRRWLVRPGESPAIEDARRLIRTGVGVPRWNGGGKRQICCRAALFNGCAKPHKDLGNQARQSRGVALSAPFRFPRFFVTSPAPCPYLPGRTERKVFTELSGQHSAELNDALGRIGFRRSQAVAYRPSCQGCSACVSVRVVAGDFQPSASQKRMLKRHSDIQVAACKPWATEEQYGLLRRYLKQRHPDGGMVGMDESDFSDMIEQSPVKTYVVEYREPGVGGRPGRL